MSPPGGLEELLLLLSACHLLPGVSAVAAEQFGVRRTQGAPVSDDHQLHLTLVDVDQHRAASLRVHEEDDGEDGHLELRAGANEGAAHGFDHRVPAELQVQDVVVLVGLRTERSETSEEERVKEPEPRQVLS